MSRRVSVVPLALMAVMGMAAAVSAAESETENPLEPLDASSPRAAYQSFLEQTQVIEDAAVEYRSERSSDTQAALLEEVSKTSQLSDLSDVPEASRDEIVETNFAALADILLRIPRVELESIPDADAVAADELTRWTLPGTEITFKPLKKGDRKGSWVLSRSTVGSLPRWRDAVEHLPVLVEDAAISDWRRNSDFSTGPMVPSDLIRALPDAAYSRVLGSPLWKSIVALLGAMVIMLLIVLWHRWIGRRGPGGTVRGHVLAATTPLLALVLLTVYQSFMASQIDYSGQLAELVVLATTISFWIAVAWLFFALVGLVLEWVIATPYISDESLDAHLLRLISKVISAVGVMLILLFGANEIGIPALGLLAGASVGGLVVGLAAQPTIENLIGGMTLFADKPFKVGDFVGFGEDYGTVEEIGPRSTQIRKLNGTQLTVPNSDIVRAKVSNFTERKNALFLHTIGLRYETTIEQIEWLVAQIREELGGHPKVERDEDLPRVRLAAFGASSIDIEARAYVETTNIHEFMAVQGQLLTMIMRLVERAGTSLAFPSTTAYLTRDDGIAGPAAMPASEAPGHEPDDGPASRKGDGPEQVWDDADAVADDEDADRGGD